MARTLAMLLSAVAMLLAASTAGYASAPQRHFAVPLGWPKLLVIPRIHVRAPIESLAFNRPSDNDAPYRWGDVAWYDQGARPGDEGRAVVLGHLDSTCCPAVFYLLKYLHKGDIVQVYYRQGAPVTFQVQWQASYPNGAYPPKFLFEPVRTRGLALVTCAGIYHRDAVGYDHKLIVFARVVLPNGHLG